MEWDKHSLLRLHPVSRGLSDEELLVVTEKVAVRSYAPNEVAFAKGTLPETLGLVIGGRFRLCSDSEATDRIANFGPGDQFGFLPLLHEEVSTVACVADEPSMTLEVLPQDLFALMREYPLLAKNLLRTATSGMVDRAVRQRLHPAPRTVAFLHTCSKSRSIVQRVTKRLQELDETIGTITDDSSRSESDLVLVSDSSVDAKIEDVVRDKLADWSHLDRVIFDVDLQCNDIQWEQLSRLYSYSQQIYLVVTPQTARHQLDQLVRVMEQASAWKHKLDVIWDLPQDEQVAPAIDVIYKMSNRDFKVGQPPKSGTDPAVERLVHALRGLRLGIALGGGAARGMSHYGVLDILEKANVFVDEVAGTSVGAMLGATYCSGYSIDFGVESFTNDLQLPWFYKKIRGGAKWYMVRKYRTGSWDGMLRKYLGDWKLEQLPIPLQTIGVDLTKGEEVVRSSGDTVHAVLESINLPYLSPPICRDGQTLVDGGMLNVIPADTLVRSGCNYIIAVSVSATVRPSFAGNTPETATDKMKVPNIFQVWSRLLDVQSRNLSQMGATPADFTISPDVSKVEIGAFEDTPEIVSLGTVAAENALADLKQQLHQVDDKLFPL